MRISKRLEGMFENEYQNVCKWARVKMTRDELFEHMLLQIKYNRTRRRIMRCLYLIDSKKIGILDRENKEKVIVQRVKDYLYCEKDQSIECDHCVFCVHDKDVEKSLHPRYVWYVIRAFRPKANWPEIRGQKIDFDTILDPTNLPPLFPTADFKSIDLRAMLED